MATDWRWKDQLGGNGRTSLDQAAEPLTLLAARKEVLSITAEGVLEAAQFRGDGAHLMIAGKALQAHLQGKLDVTTEGVISGPLQVRGTLTTALPGPVDVNVANLARVVGQPTAKIAATLREGDAVKLNEKTYTVAAIDPDQGAFTLNQELAATEPRTGLVVYTDTDLWVVRNGAGVPRLVVDKSGRVSATSFAGALEAQHLQGTLALERLPNLPASQITAGELGVERIPNLPASKITAGELGVQRIPNLDAAKITSGTLALERLPNLPASQITAGELGVQRIPNLDATKITSGTLALERLPNLPASQITAGELGVERIPTLPASKITAGELGVQRIPNLDAAKITSGTLHGDRIPALPVAKISGLQAALDGKLNTTGGIIAGALTVKPSTGPAIMILQSGESGYGTLNLRYKHEDSKDRIGFTDGNGGWMMWSEFSTNNVYVKGNLGIGTEPDTARLKVQGDVHVTGTVTMGNPLRHRMYPADPKVYQDIFEAERAGAISKLGNPTYDRTTWSTTNLWNDRPIIRYGVNNEQDGHGARVVIPAGYDTVWVRVLGERWNVIHAYFLDGQKEDLGQWTGGYRAANCYCPDGSLSDGYYNVTQWLPIPAGRAGELALISKPNTDKDFWLSGVAFSKNPWAHAAQSAVGYHWQVNGGDQVPWNTHDWNNDVLAQINSKTNSLLRVPVVPNKRDKLLYLIEHNTNWNGCMHTAITVNNTPIERFLATYDNPFARHWNSKQYERYIAARIPAALIPDGAKYLDVRIDMSKQNHIIHFREIGTHDLDLPAMS